MTIKETLQAFASFYDELQRRIVEQDEDIVDEGDWVRVEQVLEGASTDVGKAYKTAQSIIDTGVSCKTCRYNQNDLVDGRPCACLGCLFMNLTPEQQKQEMNYESNKPDPLY